MGGIWSAGEPSSTGARRSPSPAPRSATPTARRSPWLPGPRSSARAGPGKAGSRSASRNRLRSSVARLRHTAALQRLDDHGANLVADELVALHQSVAEGEHDVLV